MATSVKLDDDLKSRIQRLADTSVNAYQRLDHIFNESTVAGERYNAATQAEIDTEQFT
jgi:predicted transcriptional regulator